MAIERSAGSVTGRRAQLVVGPGWRAPGKM
jgi:hypothetical protein